MGRREPDVDDRDVGRVAAHLAAAGRRRSSQRADHLEAVLAEQASRGPRAAGRCPRRSLRARDLRPHPGPAAARASRRAAGRRAPPRDQRVRAAPSRARCRRRRSRRRRPRRRPARPPRGDRRRCAASPARACRCSRGSRRRRSTRRPRAARAGARRARRPSRTGTGPRAASCSSATASPCPLTTAGWIPRARSRSSSSESAISLSRLVEPRLARRDRRRALLEQAELERERDEPLLRAVVQVALETLALPLPGLDRPARASPRSSSRRARSSACSRAFSSAMPAAALTASSSSGSSSSAGSWTSAATCAPSLLDQRRRPGPPGAGTSTGRPSRSA